MNNLEYEIIIVDNASTDASIVAIKNHNPDVILIESKINLGVLAWNLGFAKAKGDYLIVLDDSHVDSGLDKALDYLNQNIDVGILALNITGGAFQTNT
ncbi:MAG: glycosyltransferase [Janthinobacterium lividum]